MIMKKIALLSAIALSGLFYTSANAQILQIGLHLGGGRPVVQASLQTPVIAASYTSADDYYYLPDVDAYYSVAEESYYYNNGINWVSAAYLPGEYRNYDWRNSRRYEVRAYRPYMNHNVYRTKYRGNDFNWGRYNDRNNYANRNDRREERPRFDNRNNGRPEARVDNRRGEQHAQGNYNQPQRGQSPPSQPGRGNNSQPSRQNDSGQRGNNGGQQHFTDNQGQGSHSRGNRS
jgi:hypothetical protein